MGKSSILSARITGKKDRMLSCYEGGKSCQHPVLMVLVGFLVQAQGTEVGDYG
jgi:hypothetical protein